MSRVKPTRNRAQSGEPSGGLIDRPSRVSIFARRQRRLVRPVLLSILVVGGVGYGLHVSRLMRDEQRFAPLRAELGRKVAMHVTSIEITGRDMTPDATLRQALGVAVGDDILGFSVEEARKRIDQLAFVEHATVERRLPGTIVVRLTERRPFAVWQNQGRFVLIDRAGQVVADQGMNGKDAEAFAQLPLVVGAGAPAAADALVTALEAEPEVRSHVVAAVRVGLRRWNLTLRNGCDVMLPEGAEVPALHRLAQLQRDHQLLVRPLEAIDMRLSDRLVVRPRPAPPAGPDGTPDASGAAPASVSDAPAKGGSAPAASDPGRRPA
jgi:cell division protein FtsQ